VFTYDEPTLAAVMDGYVGATRPAAAHRDRYAVVREQAAKSTHSANPKSWWCAALRTVGCPVNDPSTTFGLASGIYVANHRLKTGAFVDFAVLSIRNNDDDDDDNNINNSDDTPQFESRFTARIEAIVVVRHSASQQPVTLLDTTVMHAIDDASATDVMVDSDQRFVMCFNADNALPCEVSLFKAFKTDFVFKRSQKYMFL